ncbi:hypothetical protein BC834DRAFT_966945 [Gloeopeniophorella convolvens]|nr:hypothetical protein BC834DRAFT_966945 [Gloeopeniophorella convolvens]
MTSACPETQPFEGPAGTPNCLVATNAYISPFVDAVRNMDHDAKYERRESSPDHNTSLLLSSIPGFDNTVNFLEQNGFLCDLTPEVQDMVTTDVVLGPHPTSVVIDPMEVPRLPEPNAHAGSPDLPRDLNALATNERFSAFYANKGTKSLNLELTWRPYNSEKAAPTLEELVGVSDFCGLLSAACDSLSGGRASIVDLLKEIGVLAHPLTSNEETTRLWERFFSATTTPDTGSTDDAFCVDEDWVEELLSAYVPQNFPLDAAQNDHEQNNLARHRSAEAIDPDPVIFPKQIPSHSGSPEAHGEQSLQGYLAALAIQPSSLPSCPKLVTPPMSLGEDGSSVQKYDEIDAEDLVRQLAGYAPASPLCWEQPPSNHRYLASVDLLQDRSLTRALQRDQLGVELLEREWLDGADLVFDCDSAAVLAPLLSLPSDCSSVKSRLIALSWKYTHITVIFRAYGSTVPFLPPQGQLNQVNLPALVINSVKKLLRDLGIANVYGTKRPETSVQLLFAASSERAAASARLAGDAAEERSRHGRWGSRLWLSADEQEGERSLNEAEGMNAFAAAAILSRTTLNDFLALSASQRLQLALPIQEETMVRFNDYVARRHQSVSENFSDDFGDREAHFLVDTT